MKRTLSLIFAIAFTLVLTACSPKYDWRDFRSSDAPYAVLFPGKPATQTRSIKLDQLDVNMSMSAAEIDGVIFAVGSAQLADAAQAPAAVDAMKSAMVKNINATITSSKTLESGALEVDASGTERGQAVRLIGRFLAKEKRIYQIVVIGPASRIDADSVETFLTSFKQN